MKEKNKAYFSASIGNVLEFYDFALFGFYASTLSKYYFPLEASLNSLLLTFTVFAVGFLCRPLGAILFGYIGDKYGRTTALSTSLFGIGVATLGMGILPTYDTLGLLAPILLSFFRIIQGISIGGEYSNSLIFVTEHLKKHSSKYPAFTTGVVSAMGVLGWFVASTFGIYFRQEGLHPLSWRVPFLFGSIVALIGLYVRKNTQDAFKISDTQQQNKLSSFKFLFQYKKASLHGFSIGALMGILFYGQFIFCNSFLPKVTQLSSHQSSKIITIGIFSYMITLPIAGWISDHQNYKKFMFYSALFSFLLGPLLFQSQFFYGIKGAIFAQILSAILLSMLMAPGGYIMSLIFPPHLRCKGVSLSYNLGATLFGGICPSIYLLIYKSTGSIHGMTIFFSTTALLTSAIFFMNRRSSYNPTTDFFYKKIFSKPLYKSSLIKRHTFVRILSENLNINQKKIIARMSFERS